GGRSRPAGVRGLLPAPPRIRAGRGLWARPGPRPRATLAVTRAHWAARRGGVDRTFVSALAPCSVPTGARAQATVSSRWRVAALDDGGLDDVLELADVPRPVVGEEEMHRLGLHFADPGALQPMPLLDDEVADQEGDILAPLTQRRQVDVYDLQAVEQVLPEG